MSSRTCNKRQTIKKEETQEEDKDSTQDDKEEDKNTSVEAKVSTTTSDVSYNGFDKWEDNINYEGLMLTLH